MFWKFHLDTSGIDTLLSKQDVTLKEILDEDDVLQECKTQNEKLIEFIIKDDVIKEMLHLVVDPPPNDVEETFRYKHKNLACEVITLDIDTILEKVASNTEHLDIIWSLINTPPPLNPLIASFFSKVLSILVCRKPNYTIQYLRTHDAVNKLIVHIEISAIMELFVKMLTIVELQETRLEISRWLNSEDLILKVVQCLHPSEQEETQYNASQLLSHLVRVGRDTISQYVELEEDPLLLTLEKKETIEKVVSAMFDMPGQMNSDTSVINGVAFLSSMMEIKRPVIEGMEELVTPMDVERLARGVQTTLEVISTRLQDFHDTLLRPHSNAPMETTYGILDPPLGKVRLCIADLISTAVTTNTGIINSTLAKIGTIGVLMDLFSRYEWNNFLHSFVLKCILAILSSEAQPEDKENSSEKISSEELEPLIKYLFQECNIVQRCLTLWEDNDLSEKNGNHRKGYMGHLTRIINEIINSKDKGPNQEIISSLFNELPEEVCNQWNNLVSGPLEETNKKNLYAPLTNFASAFDSDSEGEEYRPISMSQYEGTLQQAFENYQVQPMTNEFIESFGYDEDSVQQNENMKNPFDAVGSIDFSINANNESENEKLFANICQQKIQPFDDSDDSEEEDVWEEKKLTYSATSTTPRQRRGVADSDSDSSDDEKPKANSSNKQRNAEPFDPFQTISEKKGAERMEVDAEWAPNFDNLNQANVSGSIDWPASPQKPEMTALSSTGEAFADFTNISKFEIDTHMNSPMAIDTDSTLKPASSSLYEVKMEEDHPVSLMTHKMVGISSSLDSTYSGYATITSPILSTATSSTSVVGGYVVVDLHHGPTQSLSTQGTTSATDTMVTSITVTSMRSSAEIFVNADTKKDSCTEILDEGSNPSDLNEPPKPISPDSIVPSKNMFSGDEHDPPDQLANAEEESIEIKEMPSIQPGLITESNNIVSTNPIDMPAT